VKSDGYGVRDFVRGGDCGTAIQKFQRMKCSALDESEFFEKL
jgi:hypothetical protein